jgi:hypothetical protein
LSIIADSATPNPLNRNPKNVKSLPQVASLEWRTSLALRWMMFVRERFAPIPFMHEERIANAIELTRFPVPDDENHARYRQRS